MGKTYPSPSPTASDAILLTPPMAELRGFKRLWHAFLGRAGISCRKSPNLRFAATP
ncbi:hypothetical protein [Novosphingobium sp.]|uniref:hypothetical protein n=1 Tax=Novosphingobium sp. TaxID=1874826 RepID=UPI0038B96E29